MLPYQMIAGGTFQTALTPVPVDLQVISQATPDYFVMRNRTKWNSGADANVEYRWYRGMAQDHAQVMTQSTRALLTAADVAVGGISMYNTSTPPTFTALATTAIARATGIVTMASTGSISTGDVVRVTQSTGMLQIAGYDYSVTAYTLNTNITLGFLNGAAYAADATAGFIQKIIPNRFYPRWRYITAITQAAQAVITFSVYHNFTVGEKVSFRVSSDYGMSEMNNLTGTVQAINLTTNTITVDIDSSGFTAFAFPTSAVAAAGVSPAVCVPAGSGVIPASSPPGMNIQDAFVDKNTRVIHLGINVVGAASDVWDWQAYKFDDYSTTTV